MPRAGFQQIDVVTGYSTDTDLPAGDHSSGILHHYVTDQRGFAERPPVLDRNAPAEVPLPVSPQPLSFHLFLLYETYTPGFSPFIFLRLIFCELLINIYYFYRRVITVYRSCFSSWLHRGKHGDVQTIIHFFYTRSG